MTREEAIYILKAIQALICPNKESVLENNFSKAFDMAIEALSKRTKGEWIDKGEYAKCSICGAHSGTQFDGVKSIPLKSKFCHNCGTEMIRNEKKKENNNVHKVPLYVYASWDRSEE